STQTIVNAHGPGTIVDWSSVQSLSAAFNDGCCAGTNVHAFVAAADAFIDLSSVQSVVGPARSEDRLDFRAADGGMLLLTSLASATGSGPTRFEASGAGSVLDLSAFGVFDRPSQLKGTSESTVLLGGLGLVGSGTAAFDDDVFGYPSVRLDGSFRNELQNEAGLKTDDLRLTMTAHYGLFEVASTDIGPAQPSPITFELGELTFEPGEPEAYGLADAVIVFVDNFDNGNRPDIDTPEAVYVTGHDGFNAIQALHGGTLVLNGLNVYAYDDGAWRNLQAGLPPLGKVPFKDGYLANRLDETIGDVNGSRCVDGQDLGLLLGAWGGSNPVYDLNGDGIVDGADLGLLLGAWGSCT
ncbi:MAG: hypothetical protein KDA22_06815, partial [Phycisphaerales bacterium]|nr:hypothetical protein [Phycisphaerales bacterium]